jgi:hypothetical protein
MESQDYTTLYRNMGGGLFADTSVRAGMRLAPPLRLAISRTTTFGYISAYDLHVVDRLAIRWPSGRMNTASGLMSNRFYTAREGSGVQPDEPDRRQRVGQ